MSYLSVSQTAEKWGISTRRIQILCGEGRIPGAMRIGAFWAIPEDAAKPTDARIKNGKYINTGHFYINKRKISFNLFIQYRIPI